MLEVWLIIAFTAAAVTALVMRWRLLAAEKARRDEDVRRMELEARLKIMRSQFTDCVITRARLIEELKASKEREAATAEKVAKVMYSDDVELGFFTVKVAYCARYVEDWPGLFLEMVDYAAHEIIRNWREEKKRRDKELRRTCEEYRAPSQSTWGGASE